MTTGAVGTGVAVGGGGVLVAVAVAVFVAVAVSVAVLVALTMRGAVVVPPPAWESATARPLVSAKRQSAAASTSVHVRRCRGSAARQPSTKRARSVRMASIPINPRPVL